jgi:hypothetical protein
MFIVSWPLFSIITVVPKLTMKGAVFWDVVAWVEQRTSDQLQSARKIGDDIANATSGISESMGRSTYTVHCELYHRTYYVSPETLLLKDQ